MRHAYPALAWNISSSIHAAVSRNGSKLATPRGSKIQIRRRKTLISPTRLYRMRKPSTRRRRITQRRGTHRQRLLGTRPTPQRQALKTLTPKSTLLSSGLRTLMYPALWTLRLGLLKVPQSTLRPPTARRELPPQICKMRVPFRSPHLTRKIQTMPAVMMSGTATAPETGMMEEAHSSLTRAGMMEWEVPEMTNGMMTNDLRRPLAVLAASICNPNAMPVSVPVALSGRPADAGCLPGKRKESGE